MNFQKIERLTDQELLEYHRLFEESSKRAEDVKVHSFDSKFLMHVVRLLDEAEQILATGDLDLQKNREQLKAIRRGEMTEEEIRKWASDKEASLEKLYIESKIPHSPDEQAIKTLLLSCLEHHYGSLSSTEIVLPGMAERTLSQIGELVRTYETLSASPVKQGWVSRVIRKLRNGSR